jgi:indolepyruvate ferredoxin oxidoreductase
LTKTVVTLADKYERAEGPVLIGALQAFVRLLVDQSRRDREAGLVTAGYVTGYRGSPVTTLDAQLWAAEALLARHDIRFEPGLNEELAATSLRGTQQIAWFGTPRVQGVFSLWYAKGVGVDRAHESLKLGTMEGASRHGGVLLLAGDDHGAKSSVSAHQSDQNLAAAFVPTLSPATTAEILSLGQFGWALSRHSGLYCGFKTVTDTLDLTSSLDLPGWRFPIIQPERTGADLNLREGMSALDQEALTVEHRLPAAQEFVRVNRLDARTHGPANAALVIVTAGKAWLDTAQALIDLGLTDERCRKLGVAVLKLALTWPVDPEIIVQECGEAGEVLVVEEKRGWIEPQLAEVLYRARKHPVLSGKHDPQGASLLPAVGTLDAGQVRRAIMRRLHDMGRTDEELEARAVRLEETDHRAQGLSPVAVRPAYFCSGCPHNLSTALPEGSNAMGATGCHGLAHFMPGRRTMQTVNMGNEGMPWLGAQSFVDTPHMFQNLGDGTYTHSGLLAIRASVAAKSNVTFKILYNDAVAMTGGQPAEGALTPLQIVREMLAEGVRPVVLVTEDTTQYDEPDIPPGVRVLDRDELERVQRELRELRGTSAIVYEQTCANEKRRRRKRGEMPDPDRRLFINEAVCEGCGDCSVQSNCLSVEPVETEFGRKRRINQSSCNKDMSCIKGFCPSFVTVEGGSPARRSADFSALENRAESLPDPRVPGCDDGYNLLVAGIGGTGVLTVGAVLAMAAHLEGKAAKLLDMTGMAQKGGAVISHLRIAPQAAQIPSARIGPEMADAVIACDLVVGSSSEALAVQGPRTTLIANEDVVPTGEFQTNQAADFSAKRFLAAVASQGEPGRVETVHAGDLATHFLGDAIFTNFLMVGYAAQKGLLPVSLRAIDEALALNGTSLESNRKALLLGRLAAQDPDFVAGLADLSANVRAVPDTLEVMVESRAALLAAYQDERYASAYRDMIAEIEGLVAARGVAGAQPFLISAAEQLARLMAYKDEYEVARLNTRPEFAASIRQAFDGNLRLSLNLAPPFLPLGKDRKTGRPRKVRLGSGIFPLLRLLAKGKRLRGGLLDPFGYSRERRTERALVGEYRELLRQLASSMTEANAGIACEIAESAALVRGYGPVKDEGLAQWRSLLADKLAHMDADAPHEKEIADVRV